MEKVKVDNRREVWERMLGGDVVEEIYRGHSSEEEKLHSCTDIYATCRPGSSWNEFLQRLYDFGEMSAAKEGKAFLQKNGRWISV